MMIELQLLKWVMSSVHLTDPYPTPLGIQGPSPPGDALSGAHPRGPEAQQRSRVREARHRCRRPSWGPRRQDGRPRPFCCVPQGRLSNNGHPDLECSRYTVVRTSCFANGDFFLLMFAHIIIYHCWIPIDCNGHQKLFSTRLGLKVATFSPFTSASVRSILRRASTTFLLWIENLL